jgi:glyoxylase-like metal-dependent hydrolase (beta-lactamase superfamily II)
MEISQLLTDIDRNLPDFAFLAINNKTGEQIVFDLGTRKDFWNSVPAIADLCENHVPGLRVEKDVTEILEQGGVKLGDIKSLILSHWHFDHCMSTTAMPAQRTDHVFPQAETSLHYQRAST